MEAPLVLLTLERCGGVENVSGFAIGREDKVIGELNTHQAEYELNGTMRRAVALGHGSFSVRYIQKR